VLMRNCSLDQARQVADSLRRAVDTFQFRWQDNHFAIAVSIGVVPINRASDSINGVLIAADNACYAAKDEGRNRIHVYSEDDAELARRYGEMQWVAQINRALAEDRFHLIFHPISATDAKEWKGDHYELLLRMTDDAGRVISPSVFLPAAERYNLAPRLDRWVVSTALNWLASQPEHLDRLHLCGINLSGLTLGDPEFLPYLIELFRSGPVPPEKICFEVTETAAIANLSNAMAFFNAVRALGCRFALDDFGSGLSSFAYLKNLPVDYIKIDGMFVRDILNDPIDLAMVRSIHEIARVMGKRTIAEFVEQDAIRDRLSEIGVDFVQGAAIGAAEPLPALLRFSRA
jgi:EAL domain-containing protein (putative c-di-GMP-specific phosphodiesterase class I)